MNNAFGVNKKKTLKDLSDNDNRIFFGQNFSFVHLTSQIAIFTIFRHNVYVVRREYHIQVFYYILALELFYDTYLLVQQLFWVFRTDVAFGNYFYRNFLTCFKVHSFINQRKSPSPNYCTQLEFIVS